MKFSASTLTPSSIDVLPTKLMLASKYIVYGNIFDLAGQLTATFKGNAESNVESIINFTLSRSKLFFTR